VLLCLTALTAGMAAANFGGPARVAATVAFFLVAPGWAVVGLVGAGPPASTRVALSVAVSVAIDVLVAGAMLLAHAWHPTAAFAALLGVTAALLVARIALAGRR